MSTNKRFKDLTGLRYGRLTVLKLYGKDKHSHNLWLCKCDCGNTTIVCSCDLKKTNSCGCLARELTIFRNTTHGQSKSRLYRTWHHMIDRCNNPHDAAWINYGGRGIKICDEWLHDFNAFFEWATSHGYKSNLTLDRINVNGDYSPDNCRWVDVFIQANNRRDNIWIEHLNVTRTLKQWCDLYHINYHKAYYRYKKGIPFEAIMHELA